MKYIFSVLGYFIVYTTSAQLPVVFKEGFNDNSRGWWIGQTDSHSMNMQGGKYIITTTLKNVGRYSVIDSNFDKGKDFILEATFVQESGSVNHGFGLLWGNVTGDKHHEFIISSSGNYKIRSTVSGENINQWIPCKINLLDSENVLRIESINSEWHY